MTAPTDNLNRMMTLEEARQVLGLDPQATRKEVRAAYRRAARRWHPDRAPAGEEENFRSQMQQVNAAYQRIVQFIENYRYNLVESAGPENLQKWWTDRFYTGVWGPPASKNQDHGDD
jgi:DnaJ-class molecular chaperone